ncbi:MAG: BrnT family toxin [Chromatiaceae bacterium]|nr:MAG: BrnT family toxin [Chromatiaceae bacterium]
MKIHFDPAKDAGNQAKHGVPLSDAMHLNWNTLMAWEDRRKDYGEQRMVGLVLMGDRLYSVVYVDRETGRRVISLRKANRREVLRYVDEN